LHKKVGNFYATVRRRNQTIRLRRPLKQFIQQVAINDFLIITGHNDHNYLNREFCNESAICKHRGSQKGCGVGIFGLFRQNCVMSSKQVFTIHPF
jgi:hypothetical protein